MTWFYLSFASENKFHGSAVVEAESLGDAVEVTRKIGIYPDAAEVLGYSLRPEDVPAPEWCNRLLTKAEVHQVWPGQMVRLGDYRDAQDELREIAEAEERAKTAKWLN